MIKSIHVRDLEPGMFISDMNTPWIRHPFFPNRLLLRKPADVDQMLKAGMVTVHIDTARGKDSPKAVPLKEVAEKTVERMVRDTAAADDDEALQKVPFEQEFRRARQLYAEAKTTVKRQFREVGRGQPLDAEAADGAVSDIIASVFRNRDAYLSLSRLKSFDEYTFHHSLNVAVLSINLAVGLGILNRELLCLGIGAILHDIGKVLLPDGLVQKPGRLDPKEYEQVKTHSLRGASLLLGARSIPVDCAAVPLDHHERYDGTGYPRSTAGARVGKFGLIAAVADVYDAMTSRRPYQAGMAPAEALRRLYGWAGTHFHPVYVQRFIQCVGIYPIGSLVRLDTAQVGVVVKQNRGDLLRPWVRLVRDARGAPLLRWGDVDLRQPDPAGERPSARSIERVLHAPDEGIDVDAVLAGTPFQSGAPPGLRATG